MYSMFPACLLTYLLIYIRTYLYHNQMVFSLNTRAHTTYNKLDARDARQGWFVVFLRVGEMRHERTIASVDPSPSLDRRQLAADARCHHTCLHKDLIQDCCLLRCMHRYWPSFRVEYPTRPVVTFSHDLLRWRGIRPEDQNHAEQ
jgi:hypothetical protein